MTDAGAARSRGLPAAAVLLAAALLLVQRGAAQDLGEEWTALSPQEARVTLSAPGLEDQIARYLRSSDPGGSYTLDIAVWTGPAARHAKAMARYVELTPGHYFMTTPDPRDFVEGVSAFRDRSLEFEGLATRKGRYGRIKARRFRFDEVRCIAFSQVWNGFEGEGEKLLNGYYCADPGQPLTEAAIDATLSGIAIKGR